MAFYPSESTDRLKPGSSNLNNWLQRNSSVDVRVGENVEHTLFLIMKQWWFRICNERHQITLFDTVRTVSFPSYLRKANFFRFLQLQKKVQELSATFGHCYKFQSLPLNRSATLISSRFSYTGRIQNWSDSAPAIRHSSLPYTT